ncbi:hypothetical protein DV515_00002802 [Chloebia gouldiae]|uniref:Uncharacterized protein n=1 Tax=Chloebia gouldiae TaxID=44316 RepID=A0A3L8SWH5_CHLGU|nr:hypothetical protein DV515_00002802 [Chloebia gouldiae]
MLPRGRRPSAAGRGGGSALRLRLLWVRGTPRSSLLLQPGAVVSKILQFMQRGRPWPQAVTFAEEGSESWSEAENSFL